MKSNIINIETVKKAKELAIDYYKELISQEYLKNGINYSGNILDFIKKTKIKQLNNNILIVIDGGKYTDYFSEWKNSKIGLICLFDKDGNLIYKRNSIIQDEKSIVLNYNNIYFFKKGDIVEHYDCNNNQHIIDGIKEEKLFFTNYSNQLVCLKDINYEYIIYNQNDGNILFTCKDITNKYEEYPSMDKNLLLVRKRIIYKDLYSDIEFFIDKSGNIVSKIIDCTYGIIYNNYNTAGNDFAFNVVKLYLKQKYDEQEIIKGRVNQLKKKLT